MYSFHKRNAELPLEDRLQEEESKEIIQFGIHTAC
jgi:hypothetical protein